MNTTFSDSYNEKVCAVCGDTPAKIHYSVLACLGCKGFFRRGVKEGRNKYVCRFNKCCVVDKFQRNSCRYCRFHRCLNAGMDPNAVRPDRDSTVQKTEISVTDSSNYTLLPSRYSPKLKTVTENMELENDCFTIVTTELYQMENNIIKSILNKPILHLKDLSLKGMISTRLLTYVNIEVNKDNNNSTTYDNIYNEMYALWKIIYTVDFVNTLSNLCLKYDSSICITLEDKIALIQVAYPKVLLFQMFENFSNVTEFNNFLKYDTMLANSFHKEVMKKIVRHCPDFFSNNQLKTLIKAILILDPDVNGLRPIASVVITKFRKHLFEYALNSPSKFNGIDLVSLMLYIGPLSNYAYKLRKEFEIQINSEILNAMNIPHFSIIKDIVFEDKNNYLFFASPTETNYNFNPAIPTNSVSRPVILELPTAFIKPAVPDKPKTYKLPLTLTKSIEEMLKCPNSFDVHQILNKPLINTDWADLNVSTPSFDRDIVAKFFPGYLRMDNNHY